MAHVYAVACPLMIFLCAIYFVVKYAVEKYILARHYSRPRISYGRRARMVTKYTMSSVVLGQWCTVILLWLVGRFSEAKLVMVSASLATLASLVYVNRKFKICGREVNLVALVIKHTRMNQIMGMTSVTQKVMGAVNTFSGQEEEEEGCRRRGGGKRRVRRHLQRAQPREVRRHPTTLRPLFHVSSLFCVLNSCAWDRSLRKDIEDERLWQPGMELVENPLSSGAHAAGSCDNTRPHCVGAPIAGLLSRPAQDRRLGRAQSCSKPARAALETAAAPMRCATTHPSSSFCFLWRANCMESSGAEASA